MPYPNKRAQLTLFVVIAIIAVAVIAMYFMFKPQITRLTIGEEESKKLVQAQIADVKDYVESCVEVSALKGINTIGRQGGRLIQEGDNFAIPIGLVDDPVPIDYAYFYNKETERMENDLPSIDDMSNEIVINLVYDSTLEKCLKLSPFSKKFDVDTGTFSINTVDMLMGETNGRIVIPFSYPVTISLGDVSTTVDDYTASIPINLYKIRQAAANVINAYATGKSVTEVQIEYATLQEVELRSSGSAEMIFPETTEFTWIPSDSDIYNTKNTLITITYENPSLEKPFIAYFLIGQE